MYVSNRICTPVTLLLIQAWFLLAIPSIASPDSPSPITREGKYCPIGYRKEKNYCVPRSGSSSAPNAIAKRGACPLGYRKEGDYCVIRAGNSDTRHIIERRGSCPLGYRKSGNYCIERG